MAAQKKPQLNFESQGPITVGTISNANMLDAMNVTDFGNEVLDHVKGKKGLNLLLDFHTVDYMSSAALTELLRINDEVGGNGGTVRLCGLSKDIRKVFEITNLEKLFVIHDGDSVDQASKRFARSLEVAAQEDSWGQADTGG